MKNTTHISYYGLLLLSCLLLFFQRIYSLENVGLFDYDASTNYLICREIARGNWTELFHHASPTLHILNAAIFLFFESFLSVEYFNALLNLLSFVLLTRWLGKHFVWKNWEQLLFLLFVSSSTFMVYSARCITIANLTLPVFILFFKSYVHSLENHKHWLKSCLYFALLFSINYKILLLLPPLLLIELLYQKKSRSWKSYALLPLLGMGIVVFYSLLGWSLGVRIDGYLANLYGIFKSSQHTFSVQSLDIFYYLNYWFFYESPLLWIAAIFAFFFGYKKLKINQLRLFKKQKNTLLLLFLCFCLSYGMLLVILPKAPRAAMYLFPFLYLFIFLVFRKSIQNKLLFSLFIFVGIGYQVFLHQTHIYKYATFTNYPNIVSYLQEHNIKKLLTSTGINIVAFLEEDIQLEKAFSTQELLEKSKEQGISYALIDNYHIPAQHDFDSLKKSNTILTYPEPLLLSPYIFLEHSEFTSYDFWQMDSLHQVALQDSVQLRLIKIAHDEL